MRIRSAILWLVELAQHLYFLINYIFYGTQREKNSIFLYLFSPPLLSLWLPMILWDKMLLEVGKPYMVNDRVNAVVNVMVNHMTYSIKHREVRITAPPTAQNGLLFSMREIFIAKQIQDAKLMLTGQHITEEDK